MLAGATCFNLIAGALKPTSGAVELEGVAISGRRPEEIRRPRFDPDISDCASDARNDRSRECHDRRFARTANVKDASDIALESLGRVGLRAKASMSASSPTSTGPQDARTGARRGCTPEAVAAR